MNPPNESIPLKREPIVRRWCGVTIWQKLAALCPDELYDLATYHEVAEVLNEDPELQELFKTVEESTTAHSVLWARMSDTLANQFIRHSQAEWVYALGACPKCWSPFCQNPDIEAVSHSIGKLRFLRKRIESRMMSLEFCRKISQWTDWVLLGAQFTGLVLELRSIALNESENVGFYTSVTLGFVALFFAKRYFEKRLFADLEKDIEGLKQFTLTFDGSTN